MNDLRSPLRRIAPLAAVILVALAMAGCTKKVTNVDASYTAPEGQYSADARLIVYPDAPITVRDLHGPPARRPRTPARMSSPSTEQVYVAPGALHGVILDGTPASGYQVLRRESNGGYAQLKDYVLNPVARFLDSQWELYAFSDAAALRLQPALVRGARRGRRSGDADLPAHQRERAGEHRTSPTLPYTGDGDPARLEHHDELAGRAGRGGLLDPDLPVQGRHARGQLLRRGSRRRSSSATSATTSSATWLRRPREYKLGEPGAHGALAGGPC